MSITAAALVALFSRAAHPYVRTRTDDGTAVSWKRSCVFITPNSSGSADVGANASLSVIQASLNTWNAAAENCGAFIRFHLEPSYTYAQRGFSPTGYNMNAIVWLEDRWGNEDEDYDPAVVAVTTLTFVSSPSSANNGEILDADIEFNGVHHVFTMAPVPGQGRDDIQNTLTHELGHVLGLDHPCDDGTVTPRPTDHLGNLIPYCFPSTSLTPEILNATMYNFADADEDKKRSLEADDILGLCQIYPAQNDPEICEPIDFTQKNCGCHAGRTRTGSGAQIAIFLLLLLLVWAKWMKKTSA